eukprot:g2023.t1
MSGRVMTPKSSAYATALCSLQTSVGKMRLNAAATPETRSGRRETIREREPLHMHSFADAKSGRRIKFKVFQGGIVEEWIDGVCEISNLKMLTYRNGVIHDGSASISVVREDRNALQMWLRLMAQNVRCKIKFGEEVRSEDEDRLEIRREVMQKSKDENVDRATRNRKEANSAHRENVTLANQQKRRVKNRCNKKRNVSLNCSFVDEDETSISFRVEGDTLMECCDGVPVFLDGVHTLVVNRKTGNLYDRQEIIPVQKKDRKRVFRWLDAVKDQVACDVVFEEDSARSCAFVDKDGSKIVFRIQSSHLEEWCDGERVVDKLKRLDIDEIGGTINDGDAILPVRKGDRKRVFKWIRNVAPDYSCAVGGKTREVDSPSHSVKASERSDASSIEDIRASKHVAADGRDLPRLGGDPNELIGYVVRSVEEDLEFVITAFRRDQVEFVALCDTSDNPLQIYQTEPQNFFQDGDGLEIVRRATNDEMRRARAFRSTANSSVLLEKSTFAMNFTDANGLLVEFVVNENVLEQWLNGKLVCPRIDRLRLDAKEGIVDDGDEVFRVLQADRGRVFRWLRQMAPRTECEIEDDGALPVENTNNALDAGVPESTLPDTFRGRCDTLFGVVFVERSTGEPFVIIDTEPEIRYVSLIPRAKLENAFSCKQDAMKDADLRIERIASNAELERARNLWMEEKGDDDEEEADQVTQSVVRPTTASSSSSSSKVPRRQDILRANDLIAGMSVSLLFNDVRWDARIDALSSTHVDVSYVDGSKERVRLYDVSSRAILRPFNATASDVHSCSFTDEDGSYVEFVARANQPALEEWCDCELVSNDVKRLTIDKDGGTVHDGMELIPIRRDDRERVFAWILESASKCSSCDVGYAKLVNRDGSDVDFSNIVTSPRCRKSSYDAIISSTTNSSPRSNAIDSKRTCSFTDVDGSHIEFKVVDDARRGFRLEEWCDKKREIARVAQLTLDSVASTVHDGDEIIPLRSVDVDRVFDWLSQNSTLCSYTLRWSISKSADVRASSMTKANEKKRARPKEIPPSKSCTPLKQQEVLQSSVTPRARVKNKRCMFFDEDESLIEFVRCDNEVALQEWCDGEVTIEKLSHLVLNKVDRTIFDGEEHISVKLRDVDKIFDWLRRETSKPGSHTTLSYAGGDSLRSCEFVDAEGSAVKFIRNGNTLEEWCDGSIVLKSVRRALLDDAHGTIDDGSELIPVRQNDKKRVFEWLRRVSNQTTCVVAEVSNETAKKNREKRKIGVDLDLSAILDKPRKKKKAESTPKPARTKLKRAAPTSQQSARLRRRDESQGHICTFHDEEESLIQFVASENGSLQEWCDGTLAVECVERLTLDRIKCLIFDGIETIPVRRVDMDGVFAWLMKHDEKCAIDVVDEIDEENRIERLSTAKKKRAQRKRSCSAPSTSSNVSKKMRRSLASAPASSTSRRQILDNAKVGENDLQDGDVCSFSDMDGTEIRFVVRDSQLEEWCDGELEFHSLESIVLNEKEGLVNDGAEDIPLWQKDIDMVFRWLRRAEKVTSCSVVVVESSASSSTNVKATEGDAASSPPLHMPSTLEVYKRPSGRWVARVYASNGRKESMRHLGVYATRERAEKRWRDFIVAEEESGRSVCDDVPVPTKISKSSSQSAKQSSPSNSVISNKDVASPLISVASEDGKRTCSFEDADGSHIKFVQNGGVLEEWVDGKRLDGELKSLHVDSEASTIFDSEENIPVPAERRDEVFAWLRTISGIVSCQVIFDGEGAGAAVNGESCSFTDADGTVIMFVVRDGSILEEWCDGQMEIAEVSRIVVISGTIDDGDEIIPVRKPDRQRVFGWLRSVSDRVTCNVTFVSKEFVSSSKTHQHDGDTYYSKLKLGGQIISEGDFIRVKLDKNETVCGESVDVGIAQVLCMWEDVYKEMWVEHRWMYYPEATRQGRLAVHHRYEVLESDHVEENVVDVIHAKIAVVAEDSPDVVLSRDTFLCSMFYSPQVGLVRKVSGEDRVTRGMTYSRRKAMDFGVYHSLKATADPAEVGSDVEDDDDSEYSTRKSDETSTTLKFSDACRRLQLSAIPPSLPCRESERHEVESFIREAIESGGTRTASSLYISGLPGTGKTATVLEVIRGLHREQKNGSLPPFRFLEINAMRLKHPRDIYSEIYRFIGPSQSQGYIEGDTSDKWGHYREWGHYTASLDAAQLLTEELSKPCPKRQFSVILVDELDFLKTKTQKVLYNLLEWPTWRHSRLLVVGIANTMDLPERLLPKLSSRLALQRIVFKPYSRQQIQEIVTARLKGLAAFREEAIEMCARKVSSISGDVRRALQICRRAAENRLFECRKPHGRDDAQRESSRASKVDLSRLLEIGDVNQAVKELSQGHMTHAIRDAATYERIWLVALALHLRSTGLESANVADIYPRFKSLCVTHSEVAAEPVPGPEQVLRMCERLAGSNIVLLQPSRSAGMRIPNAELNCQIEDVAWALQNDRQLSKRLPA